jgi:hypothetical protein
MPERIAQMEAVAAKEPRINPARNVWWIEDGTA